MDQELKTVFMGAFIGEAWELVTGLPHRSDLDRDAYNHIARFIAPEQIAQLLRAHDGGAGGRAAV